jgi:bifunctional DNA-binding transcriptional regulator/antitoxin component of YhaV-PrlF toxin-antitoxin module
MRHIVKVDKTNDAFRIVIPKNLIREKLWIKARYVFIESGPADTFIVRRFIDDEASQADS